MEVIRNGSLVWKFCMFLCKTDVLECRGIIWQLPHGCNVIFVFFALSMYSMAAETTTSVVSVVQLVPS